MEEFERRMVIQHEMVCISLLTLFNLIPGHTVLNKIFIFSSCFHLDVHQRPLEFMNLTELKYQINFKWQLKTTQEDKASSEAECSISKAASVDEEVKFGFQRYLSCKCK